MININQNKILHRSVFSRLRYNIKTHGLVKTLKKIKTKLFFNGNVVKKNNFAMPKYNTKQVRLIQLESNPLVSIIIPAYNQWDYTYGCICSILDKVKDCQYEIILADDNSSDETRKASQIFTNIVHVRNPVNLGFLKNCNNAAKHARGEFIVFLNNDTQVMENWLEELLICIQSDEKIGLVGSKLLYQDGRLQEAGGIVWRDGNAWNYGRLDEDPSKPEYNYIKEVDYISGASIMVRKNLWNVIGGFDERYTPAYCEDSDLCFSLRKLGYKVVFNPFSEIIHFEGISHGTNTDQGIKQYQIINQNKFKEKWHDELQKQCHSESLLFKARDRSFGKKTILVIDHYVPTFDKDAGSRTMFNFLTTLSDLGFHIKFLGDNFCQMQPYTSILQKIGVEVLYGGSYKKHWKNFMRDNINFVDFVLLSRAHISQKYLEYIKDNKLDVKTVYYGHDLGFIRLEQQYNLDENKDLLEEVKYSKSIEGYMYENCDYSLVCSITEMDKISLLWPNAITKLVPAFYFPLDGIVNKCSNRDGLLFVGGFAHYPNINAVIWFLENIYSYFDKLGIKFMVAGSNIPKNILDYGSKYKHLEFYLNVSDKELDDLYQIARVAVIPLKLGAGVKGKVIEAMSKGVPTVGTSIAYDGLPNFAKLHLDHSDDVDLFINHVNKLLNNDELWNKSSKDGLEYVKQNFSKDAMACVLKNVFV